MSGSEKPAKVKDTQTKKDTKDKNIESYFHIKWLTGC